MIKPMVFGYIRALGDHGAGPGISPSRLALVRFATREGFALGQVFVDTRRSAPWQALDALVEAAAFSPVAAIVVPTLDHLGPTGEQSVVRARIEDRTGVTVISVQLRPPPGQQVPVPRQSGR